MYTSKEWFDLLNNGFPPQGHHHDLGPVKGQASEGKEQLEQGHEGREALDDVLGGQPEVVSIANEGAGGAEGLDAIPHDGVECDDP